MNHRLPGHGLLRRVALGAVLLFTLALAMAPARAETVGKREMREARTAVQEGRLEQALALYEGILESAPSDEQRFEALEQTVLILLSSDGEEIDLERVRPRLEALEKLVESVETESKLEIRALVSLVESRDRLEAGLVELEREFVAASEAAAIALEEAQARCAEALEERDAMLVEQEDESTLLEQHLDLARRHLALREEELVERVEELGRCRSEMQFLIDQLEGTHASEAQMLEVVLRKNEELAKARRALERREGQLAEQTKELEAKQEEIRKREEAIREVTERVLGKVGKVDEESPDS